MPPGRAKQARGPRPAVRARDPRLAVGARGPGRAVHAPVSGRAKRARGLLVDQANNIISCEPKITHLFALAAYVPVAPAPPYAPLAPPRRLHR